MFCGNCGKQIDETDNVCPYCGTMVEKEVVINWEDKQMRNQKSKVLLALTTLAMAVALSACGHEHEWKEATCTESRICISCGETDGAPKGHDWVDGICDRCGESEGEKLMSDAPIAEQTLYDRVNGKLYIGDEFILGTYEQDNNLDNGAEDIEWIVLEKTGENEYLCISKYVLDAQVFGKDNLEIRNRWSTSYLREWLNSNFYNTAFTDADAKNLVEMSTTYYTWNSFTDTEKYRDTANDMVRVLNYGESDEFPGCVKVSEYAKAQGAPIVDDGTREHENCSDGWYMMSYNVDDVDRLIDQMEAYKAINPEFTLPYSRSNSLTVAVYRHTMIRVGIPYKENNAIPEKSRHQYLEGVRPVICVKLENN